MGMDRLGYHPPSPCKKTHLQNTASNESKREGLWERQESKVGYFFRGEGHFPSMNYYLLVQQVSEWLFVKLSKGTSYFLS